MDTAMPHSAVLEGRSRLALTGVTQVDSFDEESVVCRTTKGGLVIRGRGLHIDKLNVEGGALQVQGTIDLLEYEDSGEKPAGLLARIFR